MDIRPYIMEFHRSRARKSPASPNTRQLKVDFLDSSDA